MKNKILMLSLIAGIVCTGSVHAIDNQLTVCTSGDQERKIEVVYEGDMAVPCEVQYTKASGVQTLWAAATEEGYCEEKATGLIEKHGGWGWSCTLMSEEQASVVESVSP